MPTTEIDYGLIDQAASLFPIFYPRLDRSPAPEGATDHLLEVAPGVSLSARHYFADPARATILYFHGNGEVVGDHDDIAVHYQRIGVSLFVVDYRGYGRSGGRPSFTALVRDAHPIAEQFHALLDAQHGTGPRFIMGRSLGGYPALELAARRPERFRGLILESAAANLRKFIRRFGGPAAVAMTEELISAHEAQIATVTLPALLLHGERDQLVPLDHATGIRDMLTRSDRSLVVIPAADHNDIMPVGFEQYFAAIRAFVER